MKNKKGISEIISYVLLIVIAVGLSVLVFSFLKLYIPKFQTPECPQDVSLIVSEVVCKTNPADSSKMQLTITLVNKGLFNVTDVYIRLGKERREVLSLVNDGKINSGVHLASPLAPGAKTLQRDYDVSSIVSPDTSIYTLEIEPAIENKKGELALCDNAVITQKITCTS